MKLWAQYLHQNHWLITPAIVFLLLLLLIFFSKFTYICMNTIQWDPVNFRRDSARRKNKKIEIQTLWENSDYGRIQTHWDSMGAIVYYLYPIHRPDPSFAQSQISHIPEMVSIWTLCGIYIMPLQVLSTNIKLYLIYICISIWNE